MHVMPRLPVSAVYCLDSKAVCQGVSFLNEMLLKGTLLYGLPSSTVSDNPGTGNQTGLGSTLEIRAKSHSSSYSFIV